MQWKPLQIIRPPLQKHYKIYFDTILKSYLCVNSYLVRLLRYSQSCDSRILDCLSHRQDHKKDVNNFLAAEHVKLEVESCYFTNMGKTKKLATNRPLQSAYNA